MLRDEREKNVDSLVHRRVRSDSRVGTTVQARYLFPFASKGNARAGEDHGAPKSEAGLEEGSVSDERRSARVGERGGSRRSGPCACFQGRAEVVGRRTRVAQ